MNNIKFRVWHKDLKLMLYPPRDVDSMTYCRPHTYIDIEDPVTHKVNKHPLDAHMTWDGRWYIQGKYQDVDFMMCTNEKDKNGNLIYEGDILKWFKEFEFVISGCKNVIEISNFKVEFEHAAFWLKEINSNDPDERNNRLVRNGCEQLWDKFQTPICEIIGNIYENKELLK